MNSFPASRASSVRATGRRRRLGGVLVVVASLVSALVAVPSPATAGVSGITDVAPVWSVHETGAPVLLTAGTTQYVAYYDADLYLTVAKRSLDSSTWTTRKITDIQSNWQTGFHHGIALQVDTAGNVHVAAAMHAEPLKYYRTTSPGDLSTLTRFTSMVGTSEDRVSYPQFLTDAQGALYFSYRQGGSGDGVQIIDRYTPATGQWSRVASPLFNGSSYGQSAYVEGPTLGPDGLFHAAWVWRNTPDVSTNHDLSYAKSADLVNWTTASGTPLTLPITPVTPGVTVDPLPVGSGLMNGFHKVGFDSLNRPVITYLKYDQNGNTQIYNARFSGSSWSSVKATDWLYRWNLAGTGAISFDVVPGRATAGANGEITTDFTHRVYGSGQVVVSGSTLAPIRTVEGADVLRDWPQSLTVPRTVDPPRPMTVDFIRDVAQPDTYALRWEHGPSNGDKAVAQPWPAPTMLQVVKLNAAKEKYLSGNVARSATVTASSSYEQSGWSRSRLVDGRLVPAVNDAGYTSSSSTAVDHSEWVALDLGSSRPLEQVTLYPGSAYGLPVDYAVQVSSDATTWTTVASRTGVAADAGELIETFPVRTARYVRVLATSLRSNPLDGGKYRLQLAEVEVMEDAPAAVPTPVAAASSSYETSSWSVNKLLDGDTNPANAGWTSNSSLTANHQESVVINLFRSRTVSGVDLYPALTGNFFPVDVRIEVSVDGQSWTQVAQRTGIPVPSAKVSLAFPSVQAALVRVTGTSLRQWSGDNNQFRMQLAEVGIL